MADRTPKGRTTQMVWIALVVVGLAAIAWWLWVYRAPPAVSAEYQQSANGPLPHLVARQQY